MRALVFSLLFGFGSLLVVSPPELIIGEERIEPGIVVIFEGAVKDIVAPAALHLSEDQTNVHIEARVNWDTENIPDGTPAGGFVPYLHITAQVTNEKTGLSSFIDMMPHINLVDNFHYARNMSLPGESGDPYTVKFTLEMPSQRDLALHKDWVDIYGSSLAESVSYEYEGVNFLEIAEASRR